MRVEREEPPFPKVTITLESRAELLVIAALLGHLSPRTGAEIATRLGEATIASEWSLFPAYQELLEASELPRDAIAQLPLQILLNE